MSGAKVAPIATPLNQAHSALTLLPVNATSNAANTQLAPKTSSTWRHHWRQSGARWSKEDSFAIKVLDPS
jgi:hypothetical protein